MDLGSRGIVLLVWRKQKALNSCTVTAQLICVFVFAYEKSQFSHNEAQIKEVMSFLLTKCTFLLSIAISNSSLTGRSSSVGNDASLDASGTKNDPHVHHILS